MKLEDYLERKGFFARIFDLLKRKKKKFKLKHTMMSPICLIHLLLSLMTATRCIHLFSLGLMV
jgi:hypothetical protein